LTGYHTWFTFIVVLLSSFGRAPPELGARIVPSLHVLRHAAHLAPKPSNGQCLANGFAVRRICPHKPFKERTLVVRMAANAGLSVGLVPVLDFAADDGLKMFQPPSQPRCVRFGSFEVSFPSREVRKHGVRVRLPGQPFDILAILLERAGDVVTREELRQRLWPADTFVDFEHGMNSAVKKLRSALGDSADHPLYIETLARVGYRFIAPLDQTGSTSNPVSTRLAMRWNVVGPAAIAVAALVAGSYFYFRRSPKLTEKDSIVLADFANTTGDPVFDGALRQGLSVQLEQTPFLRVISGDQITQTLKMMEQPLDARLTPALAREVCQRTNATVEIEGSIAALGNQYVLGLNAVNCNTGEALAREQVTANGKERVLPALSDAASELRSKLGESRASLEKFDVPLGQVTTPSLEALQAWSLGDQALWKSDFPSAISLFQRAVTIDPNFSAAYSGMGIVYGFLGENDRAAEEITKGYDLRDRASEREKFFITADYNAIVVGDVEKAAQICEQWRELFPRDPGAFAGLGSWAVYAGRLDEQLAAFREHLGLDPTPLAYHDVVWAYINLGRLDEARATIQQAEANHVDPTVFRDQLYYLAFLQNDTAAMADQLAGPWAGPPAYSDEVQSYTAAYSGHLSRARDLEHGAIASTKQQGANSVTGAYQMNAAFLEALFGNFSEARKAAKGAVGVTTDRELEGEAAIVWALSGDVAQAQKLADDLSKRFPGATYVRFGSLPAVRGILAIRRGNAQEGIENLRAISSHELIYPINPVVFPMVPVYVSSEAYLEAHRGAEAAAEFRVIVDNAGLVFNGPIGALAHLGLGRAYTLEGDRAKARAAYQDFLALWKDADPNIPILKQAEAEYAKLR
jgi:eukaryotic-like serine/threonine-protein kinase